MPLTDLNTLSLPALHRHFAETGSIRRLLELARDEDLGLPTGPARPGDPGSARPPGDITTAATIDPGKTAVAHVVARAGGVVAGLALLPELSALFAPGCTCAAGAADGDHAGAGAVLAVLRGPLDEILELERTLLNLLGRLSGVATRTADFAARIPLGSRARLFDTRKTTPGLRVLEKYAVRCGGGFCHRIGLYDAVLIKDNHLAGVGTADLAAYVRAAAMRAREMSRDGLRFIEVEVDTLEQLDALLTLPAGTIDIVLLDNMGPAPLSEAVHRRDAASPMLQLEASGGITLETVGEVAATGVDRVSTGSLTHAAVSIDVALDVVEVR